MTAPTFPVARRFLERAERAFGDGRTDDGVPNVDADLRRAVVEIVGQQPRAIGSTRPTMTLIQ